MSRRWPTAPSRRASRFNSPASQAVPTPFITARRSRLITAPRAPRFLVAPPASTVAPPPVLHRGVRAVPACWGRIFQIPPQPLAPALPTWAPMSVVPIRARALRESRHVRIFQVPITQATAISRETLWRLGTPSSSWQFGTPVTS